MEDETMKYADVVLKVLATIIGLFCIPYGLLGFIGINPAGTHNELWIRLMGLLMSILGILYVYPNSKLTKKSNLIKKLYYIMCCSPIAIVIACAGVTNVDSGWDSFIIQGGLQTTVGISIVSVVAPLSLYLYEKKRLPTNSPARCAE